MKKSKTRELVQVALLVAIIVLMAVTPFLGYIPLGFTKATLIHIPVIIGSIILGPMWGAFLGAVFGLTSLLNATFNPTLTSFVFSPFVTIGGYGGNAFSLVIAFVPRILIGVVPYYVYKALKKKSKKEGLPLLCAGVAGSLTNTILVMGMIYIFFGESYAAAQSMSVSALNVAILSVIGINGVPEAIVAGLVTLAVCKALSKVLRQMPT